MSQRKLREWRKANGIKGTKIGKSYYYELKDIQNLKNFIKGKNSNDILRELQKKRANKLSKNKHI